MEPGARQGRPVGRCLPKGHLRPGGLRFGVSVSATRHSARPRGAGGAFTLVELIMVIGLIGILAALVLGTLGYVNRKGAHAKAEAEVAALAAAVDRFYLDHGVYPAETNLFGELVGLTNKAKINTNGKVYFEPTTGMVSDLKTGPFKDPWGNDYLYQTNEGIKEFRNVGFFDLWSTVGGTNDPKAFIHN